MTDLHLEKARRAFEQGVAKFEDKNFIGAQECFETALELAPERSTVLNNLAACLIRNGNTQRALEVSRRSVSSDPNNADGWVNVAASLCAEKKFSEAKTAAQKALALNPRDSDAWYHVGYCCFAFGEATEALRAYDKALEANPSLTEAIFGTGTIFATLKYRHAALLCFERCLAIEPDHARAHFARATLLQELDRRDLAIAAYQEALRHKHPDEREIQYSLASLGVGDTPDRPPASYVTRLFDAYAANFEDHLRKSLNYQVPEIISKTLRERGIKDARFLDLGCGTGLVGMLARDRCTLMVGVDLSEKMLDIARAKHCYDELHRADLVEHLRATAGTYDVVCAADVLNYFGDLQPVFDAVLRVLETGGLFIFTVEEPVAAQEPDFALQSTMRYTHAKAYCGRIAEKTGFVRVEAMPVVLRMESGIPVAATSFVLHKRS
jgi:predicted TPR repeat methyltransferase